jgi:outer membrane protein insertion porin family
MSLVRQADGRRARFRVFAIAVCSMATLIAGTTAHGQFGSPNGLGAPSGPDNKDADFAARLRREGGPRYLPSDGSQQLVTGVQVVGHETVPLNRIQSMLRTRKDRVFDQDIVKADVRSLVTSGLFANVRTYTEPRDGGVLVTFQVFERSTIRYVKYVGNRGLGDKVLGKQAGIKVGDTLNVYSVEEGRRKIEEYYHSKGFPRTTVSIFEGDQAEDRGVVYVISESKLERIGSVSFIGNDPKLATDARLRTQIKSKPGYLWYLLGGRVDRSQIDEDVQRLTAYYRALGYFKARVSRELEYDASGKWLDLTFVIDEGPQYQVASVTVAGSQRFSQEDLLKQMKLKAGEPFNLARMNSDVNMLRDLYGANGHIFADVQADPRFHEEPGKLELVYNVEEGDVFRVGQINIHIEGDYPHTRQSTVLNRLSLRPGDVIDVREVRASERRLKSSQLFETDPSQGNPPQIMIRPPDPEDIESIASPSRGSTVRGQSPDPNPATDGRTLPYNRR